MDLPRIASRLNSMRVRSDLWPGAMGTVEYIRRLATVDGMHALDLNYPEHVSLKDVAEVRAMVEASGLAVSAINLRYEGHFDAGGFTHPDPAVRQRAVDFTCQAGEVATALGCGEIVVWPSHDGFDYPFQMDYEAAWRGTVSALAEIADRLAGMRVAIEYKPTDPRRFSLLANAGMSLLAIEEAGRANLGITVDFAHSLMAGENPATVVRVAAAKNRLMGLHLNDAYGRADDGLVVGSIHPLQTIELLWHLQSAGYGGHIYFDTFPRLEDPVREAELNIRQLRRFWDIARGIDSGRVASAFATQDPLVALSLVGEGARAGALS